jgi:hypothetical protein
MATHILISNKEHILIDNDYTINWADKGKNWNDNWLPSTIHYVIWNTLPGPNEIQNKDANGFMTGNTPLSSTSDAVGTTTVADLISWGDTRVSQINSATMDKQNYHENAFNKWVADGNQEADFHEGNSATSSYIDWTKTWQDFDEHFA